MALARSLSAESQGRPEAPMRAARSRSADACGPEPVGLRLADEPTMTRAKSVRLPSIMKEPTGAMRRVKSVRMAERAEDLEAGFTTPTRKCRQGGGGGGCAGSPGRLVVELGEYTHSQAQASREQEDSPARGQPSLGCGPSGLARELSSGGASPAALVRAVSQQFGMLTRKQSRKLSRQLSRTLSMMLRQNREVAFDDLLAEATKWVEDTVAWDDAIVGAVADDGSDDGADFEMSDTESMWHRKSEAEKAAKRGCCPQARSFFLSACLCPEPPDRSELVVLDAGAATLLETHSPRRRGRGTGPTTLGKSAAACDEASSPKPKASLEAVNDRSRTVSTAATLEAMIGAEFVGDLDEESESAWTSPAKGTTEEVLPEPSSSFCFGQLARAGGSGGPGRQAGRRAAAQPLPASSAAVFPWSLQRLGGNLCHG